MMRVNGNPPGMSRAGVRWRASWPLWLIGMCIVAMAGVVSAVDEVTLDIESMSGEGWQARDVSVSLGLPGDEIRATATLGQMQLTALTQPLRDVRVECLELQLSEQRIACPRAKLRAHLPALGQQELNASLVYGRISGDIDLQLHGLRLGDGHATVQARLDEQGWQGKVSLQQVPVAALLAMSAELVAPLPPLSGDGLVDLELQACGVDAEVSHATIAAQFSELTVNNESGSLASDALGLQVRADVQHVAGEWRFTAEVASSAGQAFAQPIFLDLSKHALKATAQGAWHADGTLELAHFEVDHADVARGSGHAVLALEEEQPLRALEFDLAALQFPGAYTSYLQPLLLDTALKDVQSSGRLKGRVVVANGEPVQLDVELDALTMDDGTGMLSLTDLGGHWHWRADQAADVAETDDDDAIAERVTRLDGDLAASAASTASDARAGPDVSSAPAGWATPVPASNLHWQGGQVFGLELGATQLHFTTRGRQMRLLQPARIPLLDGAIDLKTFRVRNAGLPAMAFLVDATLQPISVQQLSRAFGWPEFGGQLGGEISRLRLRDGVISLGTTLHAQVFDGEVSISDLRLEEPFGQWPRLQASIGLQNLDLELLTSAFSFGRITGRLSGAVDGLQLFNWTPVAFDARFYTPLDDRSRHRISQRAVENIGSMGGGSAGITAALSSGVLKFFDDFNYRRLGVSCRLRNEVCEMDGIEPAGEGSYYLVKGRGLPRIDVIGSSRRVDWPRLVQQLMAVTQSGAPVVE